MEKLLNLFDNLHFALLIHDQFNFISEIFKESGYIKLVNHLSLWNLGLAVAKGMPPLK
jgi:hypothetical protein